MESRFAVILQKHRLLGWVLAPFTIVRKKDKDFFEPTEYLLPELISTHHTPFQKQIITLIAKYDEKQIFQKFSRRKKDSLKDFLEKMDKAYFQDEVRPFIEHYIAECVAIIRKHDVPFYIREDEANLHPEDELRFEDTEPEIVFKFSKTELGLDYSLSLFEKEKPLKILGKSNVLISNIPGVLLIDRKIYCFSILDSKKVLPFFVKDTIHIPLKFVQQYFDTFVLNAIRNFKVQTHGFTIHDIREKPALKTRIVRDIQNHARLELSFEYADWNITDICEQKSFHVQYRNVGNKPEYTRIFRDFEYEKSIVSLLTSAGLELENGYFKLGFYNSDGYYELLQWIKNNKSLFDQIGTVVFDESTEKHVQNLEPKIDINITSDSMDWFDVHAIVSFGPYKIPFKKLRKNIMNQDPRVLLPDNQIGIIPTEWFAKYRDLFLFSMKNQTQEVFSLRAIHYKSIQSLPIDFKDEIKTRFLHIDTNGAKDNEVPSEVRAELRPYQVEGYRWLYFLHANNFGGCLADDMGLGKTLQTITLLQKTISLQKAHGDCTASLIVCPASIVYNWYNEFERFTPHLKVFKYVGNERDKEFEYFNKYDIILTTYGLLRNDIESFTQYPFFYVVLDESQIIKNPASKIYNSVLELQASHKLALTGTPIENSLTDLWSQMNFVNRDMLGSLHSFKEHFLKVPDHMKPNVELQLKRIVNPFILRREKQAVAKDLPLLTEQIRVCKMSPEQAALYESEKSKVRNLIYESIENNTFQKSAINVLRALMRLRQIANHPKLAEEAVDESGKFEEVVRVLENLIHHHKVLIFSSFVKHLDLFKEYFIQQKIEYAMLTGSSVNREKIISDFQNNEACKVFLISIKAGGVGLNLTQADYVFILDPWWNPAVENQAISRAHRIGQKNKVHVYRFISEDTIEEKIKRLQEKKAQLAKNIVDTDNSIPFSQEEVSFLVE